jgi:hypothetical protein
MLKSPPKHGGPNGGVHRWLFRVGRQLHVHCTESKIIEFLKEATCDCGRDVPEREIKEAVAASARCAWFPAKPALYFAAYPEVSSENFAPVCDQLRAPPTAAPKWPQADLGAISEIVAAGPGLVDLWEASLLFPGDPLLCCGKSQRLFNTRRREEWRGKLSALSLIVPSPMLTKTGPRKKDGKPSEHSLYATARRIYLVCEFDRASADEAAAILRHLSTRLPLVLVVHSGGKSLHGWYSAFGRYECDLSSFMKYAVWLGADPVTWTRSQFCRMPDGTRLENGNRQVTHYFNPQHAITNG